MDFPDYVRPVSSCTLWHMAFWRTAYAMRSPLGSDERGVGCPRVVVGEAAQMASVRVVSVGCEERPHHTQPYLRRETCCGRIQWLTSYRISSSNEREGSACRNSVTMGLFGGSAVALQRSYSLVDSFVMFQGPQAYRPLPTRRGVGGGRHVRAAQLAVSVTDLRLRCVLSLVPKSRIELLLAAPVRIVDHRPLLPNTT
jgi:hypothetical protein